MNSSVAKAPDLERDLKHSASEAGEVPATRWGKLAIGLTGGIGSGKSMVADKFDFGFAVDWMRKDLGLVLEEARRNGAKLPVTALVDQFYADVQQMGGRRWDTSSLIKRLR